MTNLGCVLLIILLLGFILLIPLIGAMSFSLCVTYNLPIWLGFILLFILYYLCAIGWFACIVKFEEWLDK